ncbi:L-lactate dehydrogenase [Caproiciproducens sp. NJN-50]|uniref:L-lactate dehydrogenase n=1 Tax=Acutalibacteraceae TaxID=3082771 RepID=UPI000FFE2B49|nr:MULTISPECIES: L-lactate dehydrogenase [Acutalibacteraceae]QAT51037.1 L-lactate dehydrogenase [Caproiciproducens sp. NJN-50]
MKTRKIVVIGAGHVGSHCGFSLITQGVCDELVYIDTDKDKAVAQAMDLADATVYLPHHVNVRAGGYDELSDADICVMAAGPLPDGKQTRMDTLGATIKEMKTIVGPMRDSGFSGMLVSISNPADVIAHYLQAHTGFPAKRVISTSTTLDSARLRRELSERTGLDQKSIHAYVMGEHGESQMVPWSNAAVAGIPLFDLMKRDPETYGKLDLNEVAEAARKGGWTVLHGKKSTEFGIGTALAEIVKTIFHDEKKILPVSCLLEGQYGQKDVYASIPAVLGAGGVERIVEIDLTPEERKRFADSCETMRRNFELAMSM